MTVERLKQLEVQFLNAIQWNLLVSENEFYEKLRIVEKLMAMKEGLRRKWFTYTELELLLPTVKIAKDILNYSSIILFSYVCSVATIALSYVILSSIPVTTTMPRTSSNYENSTSVETALLPNVMITKRFDQTECTFIKEEKFPKNTNYNITIDFSIFNALFRNEMKRNYQDASHDGFFHKSSSIPMVW